MMHYAQSVLVEICWGRWRQRLTEKQWKTGFRRRALAMEQAGMWQKQRGNPECLIYLPWEQLRFLLQGADNTVPWQGEHYIIHQALNESLKKMLKHSWTSVGLPYHVLVRNNHSYLLQKLCFSPSWSKPAAWGPNSHSKSYLLLPWRHGFQKALRNILHQPNSW